MSKYPKTFKPHIYKKRGRWQLSWTSNCPIELIERAGAYVSHLNLNLKHGTC